MLVLVFLWLWSSTCVEASPESPSWRELTVGVEKFGERLPLEMAGSSVVYRVQGFDPANTYEIKVSYPAFIPADFSLRLLDHRPGSSRRLLNVEKIIFPAGKNMLKEANQEPAVYVVVGVKPAGVVAKRNVREHEFVMYNILCERVYFGGIPEQAWWVGSLAVGTIVFSFLLAKRLFADNKLAQH